MDYSDFKIGAKVRRSDAKVYGGKVTPGTIGVLTKPKNFADGRGGVGVEWSTGHHFDYYLSEGYLELVEEDLRQRVIDFLMLPERTERNAWFSYLGNRRFFASEESAEEILADILENKNYTLTDRPAFCEYGKKRFIEYLGDLAPKSKKWVKKTLTIAELRKMYADDVPVTAVPYFATNRPFAWEWINMAPFEMNATTIEVVVYE